VVKKVALWVMAVAMVGAGAMHFVKPEPYVAIVPDWLPEPLLLVYVSGVFEILGGLGLMIAKTRRLASWGLIALYVAVFPANIHAALHPEVAGTLPEWALWVRLPFQALFIVWAWWVGRPDPEKKRS
jgi:uncharacterized membrane protein